MVVTVRGELDMATAPSLEEAVRAALSRGPRDVVLDVAALSFVDCAGLGVLLDLDRDARSDSWSLAIADPSPAFSRLLGLTGLRDHFARAARPPVS